MEGFSPRDYFMNIWTIEENKNNIVSDDLAKSVKENKQIQNIKDKNSRIYDEALYLWRRIDEKKRDINEEKYRKHFGINPSVKIRYDDIFINIKDKKHDTHERKTNNENVKTKTTNTWNVKPYMQIEKKITDTDISNNYYFSQTDLSEFKTIHKRHADNKYDPCEDVISHPESYNNAIMSNNTGDEKEFSRVIQILIGQSLSRTFLTNISGFVSLVSMNKPPFMLLGPLHIKKKYIEIYIRNYKYDIKKNINSYVFKKITNKMYIMHRFLMLTGIYAQYPSFSNYYDLCFHLVMQGDTQVKRFVQGKTDFIHKAIQYENFHVSLYKDISSNV